jgi:RHS repeat-associated protein
VRSQTPPGSAPPTDKLYTGQQRETMGGVYHYKARMYNADTGRFPQADTVVPDAMDPRALNRYAYAYNSPAVYTDPTGHFSFVGPWGMSKGAALALMVGSPTYLPTLRSLGLMPNLGSYDYYGSPVPSSCALYGTSPYLDCSNWEVPTTGLDLGGFWNVVTSDWFACSAWSFAAAGVAGVYIAAVYGAAPASLTTSPMLLAAGEYFATQAIDSCVTAAFGE